VELFKKVIEGLSGDPQISAKMDYKKLGKAIHRTILFERDLKDSKNIFL
jgi:hypothetical protein